jgi:hypothetical protein
MLKKFFLLFIHYGYCKKTCYKLGTVGFTPVILALRRLRQGDYDFETLSKEKEYQV